MVISSMKLFQAIIISTLISVMYTASAQPFEGTIRYKVLYDYEDSVKQKQVLAQRVLADQPDVPERIARMKELRRSVQDNYKDLEKSKLDSSISFTLSGGSKSSNYFTVRLQGGHAHTHVEGGVPDFNQQIIYKKDNPRGIGLPQFGKFYWLLPDVTESKALNVRKTTIKASILGYACQGYEADLKNTKLPYKAQIWTTKAINIDPSIFKKIGWTILDQNNILYSGMEGIPLRVVLYCPGYVVTLEAIEVKKEKLKPGYFEIPGYLKPLPGQK
jgi:hypothetical protein